MARETGALLLELPLTDCFDNDYDLLDLWPLGKVGIVAITHISNVNGNLTNIQRMARFAKEHGAHLVIDAAQSAGHIELQEVMNSADAVAFSAHKMYGPKNIGGLIVRKDLLEAMPSMLVGGGTITSFENSKEKWRESPMRFEAGTVDPGAIWAWAEACRFLSELGNENIRNHEQILGTYLRDRLRKIPNISVVPCIRGYNPPLLSFWMENCHGHDLMTYLDDCQILLRTGNLCAHRVLRRMGRHAVNRVSLGVYNTKDDIDALVDALVHHGKTNCIPKNTNSTERDLRAKPALILPDLIVESDGVTCGDYIRLELAMDGERVYIAIKTESCEQCRLSAENMCHMVNGGRVEEIIDQARQMFHVLQEPVGDTLHANKGLDWIEIDKKALRIDCIRFPWSLLIEALGELSKTCPKPETITGLACDACVKSYRVSWKNESMDGCDHTVSRHTSFFASLHQLGRDILSNWRSIPDDEEAWSRLAKLRLSDGEQQTLKKNLAQITPLELKKIKKLRLASPLFFNALRHGMNNIDPNLAILAKKQIWRQTVIRSEFDLLEALIQKRAFRINAVKGSFTNSYYEYAQERVFLDFDYVASTSNDAIRFAHDLIVHNQYHFVANGSVPFSLKRVIGEGNTSQVTGHLHLERIVDHDHQVIVDINFPGFPLGRLDVLSMSGGKTSLEEQFLITVLHVFKHDVAHVKDLNDTFQLIKSGMLNWELFEKLVRSKGLTFYVSLLFRSISHYYDNTVHQFVDRFRADISPLENVVIGWLLKRGWPFDQRAHFAAKLWDISRRSIVRNGLIKSVGVLCSQLNDTERDAGGDNCDSMKTSGLLPLNRRLFIIPAIIFKNYLLLTDELRHCFIKNGFILHQIDDAFSEIQNERHRFIYTPMGIFIPTFDWSLGEGRDKYQASLNYLLDAMGVTNRAIVTHGIDRQRPDLWLF